MRLASPKTLYRSTGPVCRIQAAFSLVEVIVALGIIAFALSILLALMPVGLRSANDTVQETLAANLAEKTFAEFRANPQARRPGTRYFGSLGTETTDAATAALQATITESVAAPASPVAPRYFLRFEWPVALARGSGRGPTNNVNYQSRTFVAQFPDVLD
jgi:prepilin-type N-terminal cleavage/methylation domain-containing protein